jgi:hypothetical protein
MSKTMPTETSRGVIDCDGNSGISRRTLFKAGAFSFMGLGLADLMSASVMAGQSDVAKCDAVILVWLAGGPSHIDTWDPKPGQPTGGPFKAINTSADGIQLCEHMPTIARNMKHCAVIRSMTSKEGAHDRATYEMHTGYKPLASIQHPAMGALITQQKGKRNEEIPAYVSIGGNLAFGAGFLGSQFAPYFIGDINNPARNLDLPVSNERFLRRVDLLKGVDREFSGQNRDGEVKEFGTYYRDAVKMMYSKSREAFDIDKDSAEAPHLKTYGDNSFGKSVLLARRLVEKGVRFVEVSMGGWDTHANAFTSIEGNLNKLDPAVGSLIEDLNARGMLKRTMVIVTGEFGRTPKINANDGRDHYPKCFSAFVAGGGIKAGYAYGASDAGGHEPKDNPVTIGNLHATMFEALGIDSTKENQTPQGRPIRLVDKGAAVKELLA